MFSNLNYGLNLLNPELWCDLIFTFQLINKLFRICCFSFICHKFGCVLNQNE
jgi:hypothetical protein